MPSPTLRTTLGTQLARAGVAPQITQRIMRHADFRTTNRHYTVLGLADTAAAIDSLPGIDRGRTRPRRDGAGTPRPLCGRGTVGR